MFEVLGCITDQHSIGLVIVAACIGLLVSYTIFSLMARASAAEGWTRSYWFLSAAFVTGSGVWATHFVAMLAYTPGLPVSYDPGLTFISILISIAMSSLGVFVATRPKGLYLGSAIIGLAIVSMHYTGMAALRLPATAQWNLDYVIASIFASIGFSLLAMRTARAYPTLRGRLLATGLFSLAIVGPHFTGMTAVTYSFDPTIVVRGLYMAPEWMAVFVAAVTLLIVGLGLAGSVMDQQLAQRAELESTRLKLHVQELEATKIELEDTATRLQAALQDAQSASVAKTQFLATMSHELRTPLNAIIGFSEILGNELFGPVENEKYQTYHQDIHSSGKHLLRLINDILDIAQTDSGSMKLREEEVSIGELLDSSIRQMQPMARRAGVELQMSQAGDLPSLYADAKRMQQILHNLISNAIKFTPDGGQVTLEAARQNGGIAFRIRDTGIGMSPEDIPVALERFGQIDNSLARQYEGTGIGLPLAKELVELHGGTLQIESEVGVGTIVTLIFPASRIFDEAKVAHYGKVA